MSDEDRVFAFEIRRRQELQEPGSEILAVDQSFGMARGEIFPENVRDIAVPECGIEHIRSHEHGRIGEFRKDCCFPCSRIDFLFQCFRRENGPFAGRSAETSLGQSGEQSPALPGKSGPFRGQHRIGSMVQGFPHGMTQQQNGFFRPGRQRGDIQE